MYTLTHSSDLQGILSQPDLKSPSPALALFSTLHKRTLCCRNTLQLHTVYLDPPPCLSFYLSLLNSLYLAVHVGLHQPHCHAFSPADLWPLGREAGVSLIAAKSHG